MITPPTPEELLALSAKTGQLLADKGLWIALAESCTGGLLSSFLTDIGGSSGYVLGGVVSYSNHAKMTVLDVQERTLDTYGAVSPETAREMAQGVRKLLGADIGVSITGIAGPGGGTPEKPVGLVFLHLSAPKVEWGERHMWPHDRLGNKLASVEAAFHLITRYLHSLSEITQTSTSARHLDRPVVVEASWRDGRWHPYGVWIDERRWDIVGWGRQTVQEDGSTQMLVEASDGSRFELFVDISGGQWYLRRVWWSRRVA